MVWVPGGNGKNHSPEPNSDDIFLLHLIREEFHLDAETGTAVIQQCHVIVIDGPESLQFLLLHGVALQW